MKGIVRKVNKTRGYGFIVSEDGYELFFHYTDLVEITIEAIEVGFSVEFQKDYGPRGLIEIEVELASYVRIIET